MVDVYEFDRFRLDAAERQLWREDELVPLRDKVFDTLLLLVEGANRLQTQTELIDRLWPNVHVEPNNLQHNISILRKVFSETEVGIDTVRGHGYRFVAEVTRCRPAKPAREPVWVPRCLLQRFKSSRSSSMSCRDGRKRRFVTRISNAPPI